MAALSQITYIGLFSSLEFRTLLGKSSANACIGKRRGKTQKQGVVTVSAQ